MAKEAREKNREKKTNKSSQKRTKSDDPMSGIKTKSGSYIHHDLYDRHGWVTSCLGDDLKVLFEAVDRIYFEHKRKISNGNLKRGSPFKFSILRRVDGAISEVPYVPGSTLGNRNRWRDDEDEDDDFGEDFGFYGDY